MNSQTSVVRIKNSKQANVVRITPSKAKRGSISVTLSVDFDQADAEAVRRAGELIGKALRATLPEEDRETFLAELREAEVSALAKGILGRVTQN